MNLFHDHPTSGWVSEEHKTVLWVNAVSTGSECKNGKVEHFRDLLFIKCWSGKMPFDGYNYMLMLSVIGVWR